MKLTGLSRALLLMMILWINNSTAKKLSDGFKPSDSLLAHIIAAYDDIVD